MWNFHLHDNGNLDRLLLSGVNPSPPRLSSCRLCEPRAHECRRVQYSGRIRECLFGSLHALLLSSLFLPQRVYLDLWYRHGALRTLSGARSGNRFRVGDRVVAFVGYGGFATELVAKENSVAPLPPGMDYVTASSFLVAYGTADYALRVRTSCQRNPPGMR